MIYFLSSLFLDLFFYNRKFLLKIECTKPRLQYDVVFATSNADLQRHVTPLYYLPSSSHELCFHEN